MLFLIVTLTSISFWRILKTMKCYFIALISAQAAGNMSTTNISSSDVLPYAWYSWWYGSSWQHEDNGLNFSDEREYYSYGDITTLNLFCGPGDSNPTSSGIYLMQPHYGSWPGPPHGRIPSGETGLSYARIAQLWHRIYGYIIYRL